MFNYARSYIIFFACKVRVIWMVDGRGLAWGLRNDCGFDPYGDLQQFTVFRKVKIWKNFVCVCVCVFLGFIFAFFTVVSLERIALCSIGKFRLSKKII